jgi:hypothetical protein
MEHEGSLPYSRKAAKKFSAFYGTRKFFTVLTKARH